MSNIISDLVYNNVFVETVLSVCPHAYYSLSERYKNKEVTRMVISKSKPWCILNHFPKKLLQDRELVLESLSGVTQPLHQLPLECRDDREIIIMALKTIPEEQLRLYTLQNFIGVELLKDGRFLRELVELFPSLGDPVLQSSLLWVE